MTGEKENVPHPQKRVLMIETGRKRWRRPTHQLRRNTVKKQIQVWAKMQRRRTHQGLRKKTKYSRMGIANQMKRASAAKPTWCRTTYLLRLSLHGGIKPKAFSSQQGVNGEETHIWELTAFPAKRWHCGHLVTEHGHHENNQMLPEFTIFWSLCISMVAGTLVMWSLVFAKKRCKSIERHRSRIELSLKTGDERWRLLKKMLVTEFCIVLLF